MPPAVGMAADAGPALRDLRAAVSRLGSLNSERRGAREARARALRRTREERLERERGARWDHVPISLPRTMAEIGRVLPPNAIVVDEAVRSTPEVFEHLRLAAGSAWHHTSGGALGWAVPVSIGMKLAEPDRAVVALVGDGAFHFSAQSLWTAAREDAPVVVVVLDNGGYLAVKRAIERFAGAPAGAVPYPGTAISALDHGEVARGYGAAAASVTRPAEIAPAVEAALASRRPAVVVLSVEEAR